MTDHESERLREHLAAAEVSAAEDCPAAEEIWASVGGDVAADRVRELLEHSLGCSGCAEAFRLAAELGDRSRAAVPRAASRRVSPARWVGLGGLAALAAAVAVFVLVPRLPDAPQIPPTTSFRDGGKLSTVTLIPEDVPLPRDGATLRWSAGPEGSLYDVEVANDRLNLIHVERNLAVNELTIPPASLDGVASGAELLWRVEVVLPDGSRVPSPTFIHRLE